MSDDPNALHCGWDLDLPEPPFASRIARVGVAAGASELGAAVFEIEPGGTISPYHVHHGNEELLVVLAGTPELRTPDGTRELATGAVVSFPRGAGGAHQVANHSPQTARVLVVSTMHFPDVVEHLDTGTWLAVTGPQDGKAFPDGSDAPLMKMIKKAVRATAVPPPESD
jgi:uncharacterized cupin superfamily protein